MNELLEYDISEGDEIAMSIQEFIANNMLPLYVNYKYNCPRNFAKLNAD